MQEAAVERENGEGLLHECLRPVVDNCFTEEQKRALLEMGAVDDDEIQAEACMSEDGSVYTKESFSSCSSTRSSPRETSPSIVHWTGDQGASKKNVRFGELPRRKRSDACTASVVAIILIPFVVTVLWVIAAIAARPLCSGAYCRIADAFIWPPQPTIRANHPIVLATIKAVFAKMDAVLLARQGDLPGDATNDVSVLVVGMSEEAEASFRRILEQTVPKSLSLSVLAATADTAVQADIVVVDVSGIRGALQDSSSGEAVAWVRAR